MAKRREIQECDFAFKCPKQWDDLRAGDDPDKRYCEACERDVHFVSSRIELDVARKLGRCIAAEVDGPSARGITFSGNPFPYEEEATKLAFLGDSKSGVEDTFRAFLIQQKQRGTDQRAKKSGDDETEQE